MRPNTMNTKTFLPLTAAVLFAVCSGSMLLAAKTHSADSVTAHANAQPAANMKIVDLPTVTVQATAEELAFYHANRIVDLATVTVRPSAEDWASLAREQANRIVDLPAVTVRPSAEDMQQVAVGTVALVEQLATR
ncbi:hypothetical protein DT603_08860 [Pseudoxanthomonas gei]|uniref:DUF541 domain-containing protein n=2 Tax=Pseudoxanthomonas gei TaxID=1383030 RepID=A0ABX0AI65_9GAMM|nr:hypothetical protein [Pseudoxanthomonas gei]